MAEISCALTLNGAYLGLVDGFERSVELSLDEGVLVEYAPLSPRLPVRFLLDEHTLFSPPEGVTLYRTDGAIALYAHGFLRSEQSLSVLWQTRLRDTLFTLCLQGKVQLNMQNQEDFHLVPLSDRFAHSSVREWGEYFLLEGENAFLLLTHAGEILLSSEGRVLSAEETLKAEIPFHDCAAHVALCEWTGGTLTACSITARNQPTEATYALALFESALIGADCTPYLHESLLEKASSLKEFLGGYTSVVLTDEKNRVGLVYPARERVYEVRYFRVSVTDGKISNISPENC